MSPAAVRESVTVPAPIPIRAKPGTTANHASCDAPSAVRALPTDVTKKP